MSERQIRTKAELVREIEHDWEALNTQLNRLPDESTTTVRDAQGWTVKDHIFHIAAWERSVVFLLQGKPRHAGLGIDESSYLTGNEDEINAIIYQQHKSLPLREARRQLGEVHQQFLDLLQPLSDADLQKTYRRYLPDEPGEGEGPFIIDVLYGNSAHHFKEHLGWINELVGETS